VKLRSREFDPGRKGFRILNNKSPDMKPARIATLLEPFFEPSLEQLLDPAQLDQISAYIDLLQRWNARINLTAIRKEEEIVTRHFGESLFMARHIFPASVKDGSSSAWKLPSPNPDPAQQPDQPPNDSQSSKPRHPEQGEEPHAPERRHSAQGRSNRGPASHPMSQGVLTIPSAAQVLDIGSGAGFPALPLKIWAPQIHLTLIESNHKKAAFLREVSRVLTLTDINVITDRAEIASGNPDVPRAKVVTLRAVEHFETILPQAVAFLAPRATLALLIGAPQLPQLATLTTLDWNKPISIPQSQSRVLSLGRN
jgi:16S rRNA (guanine(527)-N(7))-methyltransferase RsmG